MSTNSSRSANSNSNSRRSRNSYSTNASNGSNSSNSSNSNKKRKTNQKTLGAAWGSNSLSSSRSSLRKAPFSDFGSYMVEKNRKLHSQFDAEASSSSRGGSDCVKPIFEGISIFVDGFTIPSSQELRGYMLKHGGRFENYFSRHRVTHIICSNLSDSKIKNLRSFCGGLPVVKPTWVLDSVAANKLLSWVPYQLDQLSNEICNQPKLSAFFALKSNSACEGSSTVSTCLVKAEAEDSKSRDGALNDEISFDMGESSECTRQWGCKMSDPQHESMDAAENNEPASSEEELFHLENAKSSSVITLSSNGKSDLQPTLLRPAVSTSSPFLDKKSAEESSSLLLGGHSHCHSTSGDPNFIENYFKSSRLHFIGTWRNRYRKRFLGLSNRNKQASSDANASTSSQKANIIHVDMDCFFVSVVVRRHPELWDKPVAVCHSDSPKGTAEISSANYPARDFGVKAGMFVRDAKALCPHLVIVPYNFGAYEEVADQFYHILHNHCNKVQAVSCDEAFLDITDSEERDPEVLGSVIRKEIFKATGCTASAGIAGNLLMARLATRSAKPNGQCYIPPEKVDEYLIQLPIKALPGIGHVLAEKLKKRQVRTCGQLRTISKECLQKEFGMKTGEMLWNYSRGLDNRLVGVIQESKSVGAEVNWGVRLKDLKDTHHFLLSLCKEVSLRLQGCGVQGRTFTLKIKKRRKYAEEPTKYMGCGDCENLSHSTTVPVATDDVDVVQRITMQLFGSFHIDVKDIRGVGLQVSKLENADYSTQGQERNTLRSWLASASVIGKELHKSHSPAKGSADGGREYLQKEFRAHATRGIMRQSRESLCSRNPFRQIFCQSCSSCCGLSSLPDPTCYEACSKHDSALPFLHDLDMSVIEDLPPEIFSEINELYAGKLTNFVSEKKGRTNNIDGSPCSTFCEGGGGGIRKAEDVTASFRPQINKCGKDEAGCSIDDEIQAVAPVIGSATLVASDARMDESGVMPSSLSQVDVSVLQELPEELRADIVGLLPAHRRSSCLSDSAKITPETLGERLNLDHGRATEPALDNKLWAGSPPHWVDRFKLSHCLMLNILAEMYFRSGSRGQLSSILQCLVSQPQLLAASDEVIEEATNSLCELVRQYITLKLEADIEEIYVSFRLLKRFTLKSKLFLRVYDVVVPYLQVSVAEKYGGNLHLSLPRE